jgi:hypothetical protein
MELINPNEIGSVVVWRAQDSANSGTIAALRTILCMPATSNLHEPIRMLVLLTIFALL